MAEANQDTDFRSSLLRSTQEIKDNLATISDINDDLRKYFYTNRYTMPLDKKRQLGIYLKGYMDIKIKALIEQLVSHLGTAGSTPAVVEGVLQKTDIDAAISDLTPYGREKMRNELIGSSNNG